MRVLMVGLATQTREASAAAVSSLGCELRIAEDLASADHRWADVVVGPATTLRPLAREDASQRALLIAVVADTPTTTADEFDDFVREDAIAATMPHRIALIQRACQRERSKRELATWNHHRAEALIHAIPDTVFRLACDGGLLEYRPGLPDVIQDISTAPVRSSGEEPGTAQPSLPAELLAQYCEAHDKAHTLGGVQLLQFSIERENKTLTYETRVIACGEESVGITRDITAWKATEGALEAAADHQRSLSATAVRALEAERKRVSRELHDVLGQQILVHRMAADELTRFDTIEEATAAAIELAHDLDKTIDLVRGIARGLRPETVDDLGLGAGLRTLCQDMGKHAGTQIELHLHKDCERLSGEAAIALYRIAQEALSNAIRHGQATQIEVNISCRDEAIELTVADNGTGHPQERSGSLGLVGMRERAELAGGAVEVKARSSGGTQVIASLPTSAFPPRPATKHTPSNPRRKS